MRSLRNDAPKLPRQPRASAPPAGATPPRSGGIVPPAPRRPNLGDGFEKPGSRKPAGGGGSHFEPVRAGRPKGPIHASPTVPKNRALSEDVLSKLNKAGEDIAVKLGSDAKMKSVREAAWEAVKGLNLEGRSAKRAAMRVVMASYRCAVSGSGASGPRHMGTD